MDQPACRLLPGGDGRERDRPRPADRLHAEALATGGDPLRLTRLFGISDPTAIRYCAENGTLDQVAGHAGGQMTPRTSARPQPGQISQS